MTSSHAGQHFSGSAARAYDERNSRLAPIAHCMHFLIELALKSLPENSRLLCVGVGTGAEVLALAKAFPAWTFVGVDPSRSMLDVCAERLAEAGLANRCQLLHGYVQDLPEGESFDAVLSVLVAHFVKREDKLHFFQNMVSRLKIGGCLVNTDISFDLQSAEFPSMFESWKNVQILMGATPESLADLPRLMLEKLGILAPHETEAILRHSGIAMPVRFFQAFMICGWYGYKL